MIGLAEPTSSLTVASPPVSIIAAGGDTAVTVPSAPTAVVVAVSAGNIIVADPTVTTPAATTAVDDLGVVAGMLEIDAAAGNTFRATLGGDVTGLSIVGAPAARSQRIVLYLTQGGAGGHHLVLATGAVRWPDGSPPDLSPSAGAVDCLVFDLVGGIVYGNMVGTDYL